MSKLNISENLFLDVNELNHLVKFLEDDGYKRLVKQIVKNYGVVQNSSNDNFLVTKVDDNNVTVNTGLAFNGNLDAIILNAQKILTLLNNVEHYICIRYAETHIEEGTINISANGEITGTNTKFTEVLRGQPNFPTKVKFSDSVNNTAEYEVVNIISDVQALLSGSFVAESNLHYSVIGTFTPGAIIQQTNKEIYTYDSCEVFVVDGDTLTEPTLGENEYFLAKITYSNGILYISDMRYRNVFNASSTLFNDVVSFVNLVNITPKNVSKFLVPSGDNIISTAELLFEFCYHIENFSVSGNQLTIVSGDSNKYASVGDIPDGVFNGCVLFNKTNAKKIFIFNSIGSICNLVETFTVDGTENLYIIPNANEIEIQLEDSVGVLMNYKYPLTEISRIEDGYCRKDISVKMGTTDPQIKISYRLISNDMVSAYNEIDTCQYKDDIDNDTRNYQQGGIIIKMNGFQL